MFLEHLGDLSPDLSRQIARDFNIDLGERIAASSRVNRYFENHEEDRSFFRDFTLRRFTREPDYRREALRILRTFLEENEAILPAGDVNPNQIELNHLTAEERAYHDRLTELQKEAFLEIYRTEALSTCLNNKEYSGRDLLEVLDASIYMPLSTYTQYKELLELIRCPARFTSNLTEYNAKPDQPHSSREKRLLLTQKKINALSEAEKETLVQKILRGSDFAVEPRLQEMFLEIGRLAQALNQGPLVNNSLLKEKALSSTMSGDMPAVYCAS